MIPSPLHLSSYFFTKINIEACGKGSEQAANGVISSKVDCLKHKDDPSKWMIYLGLRQTEDKEKGCPQYTFEVQVVGLFEVDKKYSQEKAEAMVRANGPAVLYGAAREMLVNLTSRGPFPPVVLPTVTFVDDAKCISTKPSKDSRT